MGLTYRDWLRLYGMLLLLGVIVSAGVLIAGGIYQGGKSLDASPEITHTKIFSNRNQTIVCTYDANDVMVGNCEDVKQ